MTKRAFSLVELSIVLVILGLLVGGVLSGQALIRAAELRSVITDYSKYITAANSFRDKYFTMPGDMANATQFWGRQVNQPWCATASGAAVTANGVCDGNGNGIVNDAAAASQSGERTQLWRQLALAGLIEGTYTGLVGSASAIDLITGQNVPASKLGRSAAFNSGTQSSTVVAGRWFAVEYGNALHFAIPAVPLNLGAVRSEEAWNIDTKLDDGKPARGRLIAFIFNTCTDAGSAAGSRTISMQTIC